ncbi:hypothetical protein [Streptomyces sp. NRRL WC-3742]|uniref:hypothetical protein n=1 Tax=Streptomyces sp. NRRL WC-3742 TaxID=1463934 RepID=UPI0004C9D787|nr:hypothetical protein [Streptomyces sp. NRRL WC-3742]
MTVRPGLRAVTFVTSVVLAAGIAFTGGGAAVAADGLPADAVGTDTTEVTEINEPDQVVPTEDAVQGEVDLVAADDDPVAPGGAGLAAAAAGAPSLPYLCRASVDYPHNSHTTPSTINVHFDTRCRQVAPNLSTEGTLSRSRWFGWEHLSTGKGGKANTRDLRVVAPKGCAKDSWYRYKGQARFYVSGPQGRGSAFVYNQNDTEIKCTG